MVLPSGRMPLNTLVSSPTRSTDPTPLVSSWVSEINQNVHNQRLIILTDSYINLYKILDISLGIVHLHVSPPPVIIPGFSQIITIRLIENPPSTRQTQNKVRGLSANRRRADELAQLEVRLFDRICTYQFKRLPVLGTFVNGLFLAALLVSAAIEGIQTCFHASHLAAENETSILLEQPLTYPGVLIGFALVGLLMQWSSNKAHQLREEDLESESLLDLRRLAKPGFESDVRELSAQQLNLTRELELTPRIPETSPSAKKRHSICLSNPISLCSRNFPRKFVLSSTQQSGFESVPTNLDQAGKVSLRSLKSMPNFEAPNSAGLNSISGDIEDKRAARAGNHSGLVRPASDRWQLVRYWASPAALTVCAILVYYARQGLFAPYDRELVAEIADASLAIVVVTLLFTASYPPMKKAGKVLLQSAPHEIDVERVKANLKTASELIVDIRELHIWSLTTNNNRVATCHVVLNPYSIRDESQLSKILAEIRSRFLEDNIRCSTIQPVFLEDPSSN